MPTSSSIDFGRRCPICDREPICGGLGVVRYDVPLEDPRFGKLYRCPNNPPQEDTEWQERLRSIGNLAAFAEKSFDNFEIDLSMHTEEERESLALALNAAQRYAQEPDGWLLLEGGYGCGKTHLAAAAGNYRVQQGDAVLFITVPDLLDHLRASYGPSSELAYDETFDRVRNAPVLILDDLGVENPSPWAQEKLFQLLNHRYSHHMPTILTTNADIDHLDGRIRSRLLDVNLIRRLKIAAPDFRSLVQNQHTQLQSNLQHYADMTFATFDVARYVTHEERLNLEKLLGAAYSYAETPQGWLLLMGSYGSGKTHLAAAIAHHRREKGEEVMFITVPDLMDYLRLTYSPNAPASFGQRFDAVKNVPLLVIDDLGTENATAWAREKLFQVLDYRYVTRLPTVITTAKELPQLDERIRTRLLDDRRCATFAITAESYVMRRRRK
jgi:DNA replication protein DnaC